MTHAQPPLSGDLIPHYENHTAKVPCIAVYTITKYNTFSLVAFLIVKNFKIYTMMEFVLNPARMGLQ